MSNMKYSKAIEEFVEWLQNYEKEEREEKIKILNSIDFVFSSGYIYSNPQENYTDNEMALLFNLLLNILEKEENEECVFLIMVLLAYPVAIPIDLLNIEKFVAKEDFFINRNMTGLYIQTACNLLHPRLISVYIKYQHTLGYEKMCTHAIDAIGAFNKMIGFNE